VKSLSNVLLVSAPATVSIDEPSYSISPPLGLAYVAAVLEQAGHSVEILDCTASALRNRKRTGQHVQLGLSWREIQEEVRTRKPEIVGVGCPFTCQANNAHKVAEIVKHVDPEIPVVFGGAHPSSVRVETLQDRNVDFLVIGEGEYTFRALVDSLGQGRPVDRLDGLGFKERDRIKFTPKSQFVENLDELPFPARHLLPMREYLASDKTRRAVETFPGPATTMITSRGCPGRCTFCSIHSVWGYKWRARSPSNVADEVEQLVEEYGIRHILFEDDNISLDKQRMHEICDEIISRRFDISWSTPNGVSIATLDRALLAKMKNSGCHSISLGIESGNEHVLNQIVRKNLSLGIVRKVVKLAREADIQVTGFFVLRMPGETLVTLKETIEFAKSLDLDWAYFFIATPYPGTELYKICKSNGYLNETDRTKLNPHFPAIETELLSAEDVQKYHRRAYYEFFVHQFTSHPLRYLRKTRMLRNIMSIYFNYIWHRSLSLALRQT